MSKKKKIDHGPLKIQISDPGPSCFILLFIGFACYLRVKGKKEWNNILHRLQKKNAKEKNPIIHEVAGAYFLFSLFSFFHCGAFNYFCARHAVIGSIAVLLQIYCNFTE